jgi:hypothetical protein
MSGDSPSTRMASSVWRAMWEIISMVIEPHKRSRKRGLWLEAKRREAG